MLMIHDVVYYTIVSTKGLTLSLARIGRCSVTYTILCTQIRLWTIPMLRDATRSSLPQTNLTIDFRMLLSFLLLFIFRLLYYIIIKIKKNCLLYHHHGTRWKKFFAHVARWAPRADHPLLPNAPRCASLTRCRRREARGVPPQTAAQPDGTRGRKGKKTQKSVRLTNFDEARNFLHGVALTPEAFYAKDENMSKNLLQCVKLYFDHEKKNAEESTSVIPGSELSELFVDGLDLEQVWEQINMQNIPIVKHYTKVFSNADALDEINLIKDGSESDDDSSSNDDGSSGSSDSDENDSDSEDGSKSSSADEEVPYNDEGSGDVKDTRNKLQKSSPGEDDDVDHDLKERIKLNTEQEKFFNFEDFEKFADGNEDLGEIDDSVDIYESMYGEEQLGEEDGSSSEEEFEDGVDLEKEEGISMGTEIREEETKASGPSPTRGEQNNRQFNT